jgi:hypothetical protein
LTSRLDTELVALGICHDGEVTVLADDGGTQSNKSFHLGTDWPYGAKVKVLPVLRGLAFRDPPKPQVGASPPGWLNPRTIIRTVLVDVRPERYGPKGCKQQRARAVKCHGFT